MSDGLVRHRDAMWALKADQPRRVRSRQRIDLNHLVTEAHDRPVETDAALEHMDLTAADHRHDHGSINECWPSMR